MEFKLLLKKQDVNLSFDEMKRQFNELIVLTTQKPPLNYA